MPLQPDPPRRVFQSVKILQSDLWAKLRSHAAYNGISTETITEVFSNGAYGIVGRRLFASGVSSPFKPGDRVDVGWVRGEPVVIISHTAKKAKGVAPQDEAVGVAEALYLDDVGGIVFRNYDQWATIVFAEGESPRAQRISSIRNVKWGRGGANFFLVQGSAEGGDELVAVYELARQEENTPFPPGSGIEARLVRAYNMSTDTHVYLSQTITAEAPDHSSMDTATADWTILGGILQFSSGPFASSATARVGSAAVGVAPNGDLIMVMFVQSTDAGQPNVSFEIQQGSLLINHTRHTILANHVASMSGVIYLIRNSPSDLCVPLFNFTTAVTPGVSPAEAGAVTMMSLTGSDPANPGDPDQPGTFNNYALVGPAVFYGADLFVQAPGSNCYPKAADYKLSVHGEFAKADIFTVPNFFNVPPFTPIVEASRFTLTVWSNRPTDSPILYDAEKERVSFMSMPGLTTSQALGQLTPVSSGLVYVQPLSNADPFDGQFFLGGHDGETGAYVVNLTDPPVLDDLTDVAALAPVDEDSQITMAKLALDTDTLQIIVNQESLGGFFRDGPL